MHDLIFSLSSYSISFCHAIYFYIYVYCYHFCFKKLIIICYTVDSFLCVDPSFWLYLISSSWRTSFHIVYKRQWIPSGYVCLVSLFISYNLKGFLLVLNLRIIKFCFRTLNISLLTFLHCFIKSAVFFIIASLKLKHLSQAVLKIFFLVFAL